MELFVTERVPIGSALLPNGTRYEVFATRHNRVWPGTDSPWTFAVEQIGRREQFYGVLESWGFFTQVDSYAFLCRQGPFRFTVYDREGRSEEITRDGRGIPDAYITPYQLSA